MYLSLPLWHLKRGAVMAEIIPNEPEQVMLLREF